MCIEKGEAISDATIPLGRKNCITAMVKQKQFQEYVEKAFAINITRNALGFAKSIGLVWIRINNINAPR